MPGTLFNRGFKGFLFYAVLIPAVFFIHAMTDQIATTGA